MKIKYSKDSSFFNYSKLYNKTLNGEKIKNEKKIISKYNFPNRTNCLLCNKLLTKKGKFIHRESIEYISCNNCGHIQSQLEIEDFSNFDTTYSSHIFDNYKERVDNIYTPKRDWIIESLIQYGIKEEVILKELKWYEFGSGLGYFLKSLDEKIVNFSGYEINKNMIEIAKKEFILNIELTNDLKDFESRLKNGNINILTSFFVLEHMGKYLPTFIDSISKMKKGSFFVFSVPIFGFSTVIENAFPNIYSNNLDSIVHTNIFSEESIDYMLNKSSFKIINKWYFAQDSIDLYRSFINSLEEKYEKHFFNEIKEKMYGLIDDIQSVIDKHHFSSNIHIIAVKE